MNIDNKLASQLCTFEQYFSFRQRLNQLLNDYLKITLSILSWILHYPGCIVYKLVNFSDKDLGIFHRHMRYCTFLHEFLFTASDNHCFEIKCLDASRTWVCYWNLHSLELLEVPIPDETKKAVISFLNK